MSAQSALVSRVELIAKRLDRRWHASLGVLVAAGLYLLLPEKLTFGPQWVAPTIEIGLLVPLLIVAALHGHNAAIWQRRAAILVIGVITFSNFVALANLIWNLVYGSSLNGQALILESMNVWMTNVIAFGLWYWELDRGGPIARSTRPDNPPDFLFPYMTAPEYMPKQWRPGFVDYLYVSFTNSTAFSPTDTLPLTTLPKLLMMVQSLISLVTVALVAAR